MRTAKPCLLIVNGGSSSIKFARFELETSLRRVQTGRIEGIGLTQGSFTATDTDKQDTFVHPVVISDYSTAVDLLMDWIGKKSDQWNLVAIGHRLVHGGPNYYAPQFITPEMIAELQKFYVLDPEHLPGELLLANACSGHFPGLPQIACFDTAFHRTMPAVAQRLAIPRRYADKGIKRYGFHGLSCEFLLQELARVESAQAVQGRLLLAHLGNGASITAVYAGKSIDTSMGFTPGSGLPMSSRAGDIDPGLAFFLAQTEQMTAEQFQHMVNHESGLLGVSGISADMRELLLREVQDKCATEAVALFCYHARRWICSLAGALEGLDTLVFSGGIGENLAEIRARICAGLSFIGVELDPARNAAHAAVISSPGSKVVVRVIRTDEELIIAQSATRLLNLTG